MKCPECGDVLSHQVNVVTEPEGWHLRCPSCSYKYVPPPIDAEREAMIERLMEKYSETMAYLAKN